MHCTFSHRVFTAALSLTVCLLMSGLNARVARAFDAELSWSPMAGMGGYKVYIRQGAQPYGAGIDVGAITPDPDGIVRYTTTGLPMDTMNYFAVTCYDASGVESGLSNELSLMMSLTPTPTLAAGSTSTPTATTPAGTPAPSATRTSTPVPSVTPTVTPTATSTPSGAVACGNTTFSTGADIGNADVVGGPSCVTGSSSTGYSVLSCVARVGTFTAGHIKCAIYADNNTKLCESASVTPAANAWNTIDLSSAHCGTLPPSTRYWITVNTDDNTLQWLTQETTACTSAIYPTCPNCGRWQVGQTYPSFPNSWSATAGSCQFSFYMNLQPNGTAPTTLTATSTATQTPTARTPIAQFTATRTLTPTTPTSTRTAISTVAGTSALTRTPSATPTATPSPTARPTSAWGWRQPRTPLVSRPSWGSSSRPT